MKTDLKCIDIEKATVALILLIWYATATQIGYEPNTFHPQSHLMSIFSHANIWHLLGNVFVLYCLRKFPIIPATIIAFVVSFIPTFGNLWCVVGLEDMGITMGFSGVIFAMLGIMWGKHIRAYYDKHWCYGLDALEEFSVKMLPWAVVGFIIPRVNWELHFYALIVGVLYGFFRPWLRLRT